MTQQRQNDFIINLVAALFVGLYCYTALEKLKDVSGFVWAMSNVPAIASYANFLSGFIPGLEIGICILLIIPYTRTLGLFCASTLMTMFVLYVLFVLLTMKHLPCTCGGFIQEFTWLQHLLFNLSFLTIGIVSIILTKRVIAINRSSRIPGT